MDPQDVTAQQVVDLLERLKRIHLDEDDLRLVKEIYNKFTEPLALFLERTRIMLAGIAAEKLAHNYKLGVFEMKHSHAYKGNDAFVRMFCSLLRMQPRLLPAAKYSTVGVQAAQDIVDEMIRRGFKEKEFEALITMYLLHLMQKELKN